MPRRSRRRRDNEISNHIARRSLSAPSFTPSRNTLALEDRREFHPEGDYRPARAHRSRALTTTLVTSKTPHMRSVSRTSFTYPKQIPICVRRAQRKEVLLALGRGGGNHRPPRRNFNSSVSCKR